MKTQIKDECRFVAQLEDRLARFQDNSREDRYANPVLLLARDIAENLQNGNTTLPDLKSCIDALVYRGFKGRVDHLRSYIGKTDPKDNKNALRTLIEKLADGSDFDTFKQRVESEVYGIVTTAHPTFSVSKDLMMYMALLASGYESHGLPLSAKRRHEIEQAALQAAHKPEDRITLDREQEISIEVLAHAQHALEQVYAIIRDVAQDQYPQDWMTLTPRLVTLATWVGYDLDGRNDIQWTATLEKRLVVQRHQLHSYRESLAQLSGQLDTTDLVSRLDKNITLLDTDIQSFRAYNAQDPEALNALEKLAQRMHQSLGDRLIRNEDLTRPIDSLLTQTRDPDAQNALWLLRARIANFGLGVAHTHVRINAAQIHNAIRKHIDIQEQPEDPRYKKSYIADIAKLLDTVTPHTINFGSLMAERPSAKRLFMIIAQMVKYMDASSPIRFLIAESDSAFTMLTALYYAKMFGVDQHIDLCPLFETEDGIGRSTRIIEALLDNPHFRTYLEQRGSLCIQTGYSDAGRFIGQTPACASVERMKQRIARLLKKHDLNDIQLVVFDTHGESVGRGAHPESFKKRISYVAPPAILAQFAQQGLSYKQETSFQGIDGYVYFATQPMALTTVTHILEHMLGAHDGALDDPYYTHKDYITEFFTTIKTFQDQMLENPAYGRMLSIYGTNLLYPTGSRAVKRAGVVVDGDQAFQGVRSYRAIPHNAILQQMGLLLNTVGGAGEAIKRDPEQFQFLYNNSERFRTLLEMIEYAARYSNLDIFRAYLDSRDPLLWLFEALHASNEDAADDYRAIATIFEKNNIRDQLMQIYSHSMRDFVKLRQNHDEKTQKNDQKDLVLLQACRLALIHRICSLAIKIPAFASRYQFSRQQLIEAVMRLDIPTAIEELEKVFPVSSEDIKGRNFGEDASYQSDQNESYIREHDRLFKPLAELYDLCRMISTGITYHMRALG